MKEFINESEMGYYTTQKQKQELLAKIKSASLAECQDIAEQLLDYIQVSCYSAYDPNFGDNKKCVCGHAYYRHFDTYDQMYPVGCKYCECDTFEEPT